MKLQWLLVTAVCILGSWPGVSWPDSPGIISAIEGNGYLRNADGEIRIARAGLTIKQGETLVAPPGNQISFQLHPHGQVLHINSRELSAVWLARLATQSADFDEGQLQSALDSNVDVEKLEGVLTDSMLGAVLAADEDMLDLLEATPLVDIAPGDDGKGWPFYGLAVSDLSLRGESCAGASNLLCQLLAQLRVARAREIVNLALRRHAEFNDLYTAINRRDAERGVMLNQDIDLASSYLRSMELSQLKAELLLELARDQHEDDWGIRLQDVQLSTFHFGATAPEDALQYVATERGKAARRYWRQARYADQAVAIFQVTAVDTQRNVVAIRSQWEGGMRAFSDLLESIRTDYLVRAKLIHLHYHLLTAQARLLDAQGNLAPASLLRAPGENTKVTPP